MDVIQRLHGMIETQDHYKQILRDIQRLVSKI